MIDLWHQVRATSYLVVCTEVFGIPDNMCQNKKIQDNIFKQLAECLKIGAHWMHINPFCHCVPAWFMMLEDGEGKRDLEDRERKRAYNGGEKSPPNDYCQTYSLFLKLSLLTLE